MAVFNKNYPQSVVGLLFPALWSDYLFTAIASAGGTNAVRKLHLVAAGTGFNGWRIRPLVTFPFAMAGLGVSSFG